MQHHPTLPPSSFPKLRECAKFVPGPSGELAERGTARHSAMHSLYGRWVGNYTTIQHCKELNALCAEDREAVIWACEYIRATATSAEPVIFEARQSVLGDDFLEITFGTPDAYAGPDLWDLKGFGLGDDIEDYDYQFAVYALGRMQKTGLESITVHGLFGLTNKVRKFVLTEARALEMVMEVASKVRDPNAGPTPNRYCGLCANALTCPALVERSEAVRLGREDWKLENYHASEITSPSEMAKALSLARQLVEWAEAVKFHALTMAKGGVTLPGFRLVEKKGAREVANIETAFQLAALPQEKFLACCKLVFGKLEDAYGEFHGLKAAEAGRQIADKLADCITVKPNTHELRKVKNASIH